MRRQHHAQLLASEFTLLESGDWVYSIIEPGEVPDGRKGGKGSFTLGYRSWAPVATSGLVHEASERHSVGAPGERSGKREAANDGYHKPDRSDASLPGRGVLVISYQGAQPEVDVPERIDGLPVLGIHNKAFSSLPFLKAVSMPDTVRWLGLKVFSTCRSLERVRLSDALESLDPSTFTACTSLRSVHLPANLRALPRKVLADCPLEVLGIPRALTEIADHAFDTRHLWRVEVDSDNPRFSTDGVALFNRDGTVLERLAVPCSEYDVPAGCRHIGNSAFKGLSGLQRIGLPNGLESIGAYAFFQTALERVRIGSSARSIGNRAFFQCSELREVVIDEGVERIGEYAFSRTALPHVHLPASLRELGSGVFFETGMRFSEDGGFEIDEANPYLWTDGRALYVRNGDGLVLSGMRAPLREYELDPRTVRVAQGAMEHNLVIERIVLPEGLRVVEERAFAECRKLSEAVLPSTLEIIDEEAFAGTALRTLALGPALRFIGTGAFGVQRREDAGEGDPLVEFSVDESNERFYVENGLLISRATAPGEGDGIVCCASFAPDVVVPRSVHRIGPRAFDGVELRTLSVHGDVRFTSPQAFTGLVGVRRVCLEFAGELDGFTRVRVEFPRDSRAAEGAIAALRMDDDGRFFRFADYDTWVVNYWLCNKRNAPTVARMILARLDQPVKLTAKARRDFDSTMRMILLNVFRDFTKRRDFAGFESLERHGYIDEGVLDAFLERSQESGQAETTAYLLDMKRRKFGIQEEDFAL